MNTLEIAHLARYLQADIVETHISWVLLTKRFAYKIKKPIKTTFLNYSTLLKRKKFCFEELRLNKVLSPDIYISVIGIKKRDGNFMLVPEKSNPIEYAVKMKRLKAKNEMDKMLERKEVREIHLKRIAKLVALFHAKTALAIPTKTPKEWGTEFKDILSLKKKIADYFGPRMLDEVKMAIEKERDFLREYGREFMKRAEQGFCRDCHGDLHAGNIFIYRRPVLFDRIEFNPQFRYIDILHEVAFLCMDLEARGSKKLSKQFLNYYLQFSGLKLNTENEKILNFYKCYTANIRAKVILMNVNLKPEDIRMCKKYLDLMFTYAFTKDMQKLKRVR